MDRARVADFYRAKGYTVREAVIATGHSGNGHRVPLLCEGPLGNLAIFFGDAGGVDGHEMGGARRVAKDLGATAIMAAPSFTNTQRAEAAELGVVLVDQDAISPEASAPVPAPRRPWPDTIPARISASDDFAAHPWPDSGRPGGRDGKHAATFEVDDLLRDLDRPLRTAPTATRGVASTMAEPQNAPPPQTVPITAPPATPATGTPTSGSSMWRNARTSDRPASPAPLASASTIRSSAAPTKFAWLGLPTAATPASIPIEVELEHSDVIHSRQAAAVALEAVPAPPLNPEEIAYRTLRRRIWIRRASWTSGVGLVVYLFLLWWF